MKKYSAAAIGIWKKREIIYTVLIFCSAIVTAVFMYYRAFFGTELSDEAYYVAEAKEMLNGNIPFAYNYSSKALGFTFLLIIIEWIYKLFHPNMEGIFLFTRLCFVTYKVLAFCIVYRVFQRKGRRTHALLLASMLLPFSASMQNFNYNTFPILTMFLAGCLLYDVIEQDAPHRNIKLAAAGLMTGTACFANPGWAVALVVFTVCIFVRVKNKQRKIKNLCFFLGAVFLVVLFVIVLISMQTSFSEFWYGFYRLFINPIPMDSLNPNKTWTGVAESFQTPIKNWLRVFFPVSFAAFCFSMSYFSKNGAKQTRNQCLVLSAAAAMFVDILYLTFSDWGADKSTYWGFSAFLYLFVFFMIRMYADEKIVIYLAIYPPIYVAVEIILLSYQANIARFTNCFTIIIPMLYVLLKNKMALVRTAASIMAGTLTIAIGYAGFHFVYRDDDFHNLTYRVESGVYKGIYTTQARAGDLPQLEEYLNSIIDKSETYAFRDNVPSAYLMVHTGTVCEISTWDILQHTYHRNSPAVMFDYYRVRDMIPDKIIYIDFGRDENLSNIEPEYRYNDWVNCYYDLVEDIKLNETYFHVMVYQYNGTFDGDYQWWIDNYWELVE